MTIKLPHVTGWGLTAGGVVAGLASAFHWLSSNVTVEGAKVCADGLPTSVTGAVSTGLVIVGALVLTRAPSTSDKVNVKAGLAAEQAELSKGQVP